MNKGSNSSNNPLGRYVLEVPAGVYPLNGDDPINPPHSSTTSSFNVNSRKEYVYPDFNRWVYHIEQDRIMQNYLQKGYYEPPSVSNELLSAKSAVHQLLHNGDKSSNPAIGQMPNKTVANNPKLNSLSDTVIQLINYRIKCNKALMKSTYKPPPRVTLTEHKKEMWLKNLANPDVPLSKLSRTIPHGIRNKVLLEQCCSKQIPISRALWFVKCVATNELRGLKRKNGPVMMTTTNHGKLFEQNWIRDWTVQVTEYIEKLTRDCFTTTGANHKQWKRNFDYLVKLSSHLFMSELINKEVFLSWIVRFLKKICNDDRSEAATDYSTGDFKLISVHLIFLKLFWFKIIKIDYLSKEVSETMLMIFMKLQDGKILTKDLSLKISKDFKFLIVYLFYYNSSSFIMSNHWNTLKPVLKRILDTNDQVVIQQFELITYRNESLLMNLPDSVSNLPMECAIIDRLDHFEENPDLEDLSYSIFEQVAEERSEILEKFPSDIKGSRHWKKNLDILLEWCLTSNRNHSFEQVYLTVSLLKSFLRRCSLKGARSSLKKAKLDIESHILEFIYSINDKYTIAVFSDDKSLPINIDKFLLLVNELYTMKLFTVSSYLRRIISSGIIYLPNAQSKSMLHILIIKNLPILHNAQCLSILKSLVGETNYQEKIEQELSKAKELLDVCLRYLLSKNSTNEVENNSDMWFQLQNLIHGVKYLAADYFLVQFKIGIEDSKKLVNLDRAKISLAFKVFTLLNCQAKFFQEFLILILSNDVRVINFYLDTLFFICTIVMSNINLIHCLVPLIYDKQAPANTFVNILKLIITNYNAMKDNDWYNFKKFWKFSIDHLGLEKSIILVELNTLISTNSNTGSREITHENVDHYLKTIKMSLGCDQFLNLDRMRANELKLLEKYLSIIKMEMNGSEEIDPHVQDALIQLLETLKAVNETEFVDHIVEFCNASILPSLYLDFESYLKFTIKILVYELININQLVEIFSKESSISDNITGNSNHRLIWYLLLDNKNDSGLSSYELLKFHLIRNEFKQNHVERLLDFIRIGITDAQTSFNINTPQDNASSVIDSQFLVNGEDHLPTPISNNVVTPLPMIGGSTPLGTDTVPEKNSFISVFEDQLSLIFNKVAFTNVQLLIDKIVSKLNKDIILEIFNGLVLLDHKDISSSKDLLKLIHVVNIFNLPLCQIILKCLWESELGPDKTEEFKSVAIQDYLMSMFVELVNIPRTEGDYKDLCFNQLFNLLNPKLELFVLDSCKSFFLRSENFPQVYVTSREKSLIPNLNEIINNCSKAMSYYTTTDNAEDVIPLNESLMFSLNSALEKLIYATDKFRRSSVVSNGHDSFEYDDVDVSRNERDRSYLLQSVTLFLKIVLMHKHFLVEKILKRSSDVSKDNFVQNLSRLYKSNVVRHDSKLRNYFYDSLLSFELLFTESIEQHLANKQSSLDPMASLHDSQISTISTNIFKLPPLNTENVLSSYLSKLKFRDGLVDYTPEKNLFLTNEKEDAYQEFSMRSFDLIEEANPVATLNNTSVSLQLFNAVIETKNPP